MGDYSNTARTLDQFGFDVIKDAKKNLSTKNINASSELSNSLKHKVVEHPRSLELEFMMEPYGKFVDQGVRGHGRGKWTSSVNRGPRAQGSPFQFKNNPPAAVFEEWIKIKPISTDNPKSAAFLMARSAGRYGLRRTRFFSRAVDKNKETLNRKLKLSFIKDTQQFVQREVFKITA